MSIDAERTRAKKKREARVAEAKRKKALFQLKMAPTDPMQMLRISSNSTIGFKRSATEETEILEDNIIRMKRPRTDEDLRNLLGTAAEPAPITLPTITEEEHEDVMGATEG